MSPLSERLCTFLIQIRSPRRPPSSLRTITVPANTTTSTPTGQGKTLIMEEVTKTARAHSAAK